MRIHPILGAARLANHQSPTHTGGNSIFIHTRATIWKTVNDNVSFPFVDIHI